MKPDSSLHRLAKVHGVLRRHIDAAGHMRDASPRALRGVLHALGVDASTPQSRAAALAQHRNQKWTSALEPVHVAWTHRASPVPIRLPTDAWQPSPRITLYLESGGHRDLTPRGLKATPHRRARIGGTLYEQCMLPLPSRLPAGYHRLVVQSGSALHESLILSAPPTACDPPSKQRRWGLFLPLYALRAKQDWGAGDWGGLKELCHDTARHGGSVVSTLPLLTAFLDHPFEPSPYSPVSRLYWNEFYIDLASLPERRALPQAFLKRLEPRRRALSRAMTVDYRAVMALKREVLERCVRLVMAHPDSSRAKAWRRFRKSHPDMERYAQFRAVMERRGTPWHQWPARLRDGTLRKQDFSAAAELYHAYVQWVAYEQISRVTRDAGRHGVDLYLDLPLGVHRDGYDVWSAPHLFALGANGGSPPDPVFTRGQEWGFPPLHPETQRRDGYRYVRRFLHHHMSQARLLRLDHVMALRRLYWVPRGLSAADGAYVRYPLEEWCALLCIESQRHRTQIIGENLGTVPPVVNQAMRRHRFRELYVVQYEQKPDPARALRRPPVRCVASVNTHDMHPFQAHLEGLDIADRGQLGLLSKPAQHRAHSDRARMGRALVAFLRRKGLLPPRLVPERLLIEAVLRLLGSSDAETVLVNLEDLWHETMPQNVPGTSTERVNWRRKSKRTLADIRQAPDVCDLMRHMHQARRTKGPST